jgi:hypothetical protein
MRWQLALKRWSVLASRLYPTLTDAAEQGGPDRQGRSEASPFLSTFAWVEYPLDDHWTIYTPAEGTLAEQNAPYLGLCPVFVEDRVLGGINPRFLKSHSITVGAERRPHGRRGLCRTPAAMERGLRMTPGTPVSIMVAALIMAFDANADPPSGQTVVLVTARDSHPVTLSRKEVRKSFLGIPITKDGLQIWPLRNVADPRLQEVFLQKVMFMSLEIYERRLIGREFRQNGDRPPAYRDAADLARALSHTPGAVTYMWAAQAAASPWVKVIGELGSAEPE